LTPERSLWLAGAAVIYPDVRIIIPRWAATPHRNVTPSSASPRLLDQHPGLPVVTWAGSAGRHPRLRVAAARHELQDLAASITGWHFDAWLWTHNSLRLPIFTLGLKEISGYLGFRPSTDVTSGLAGSKRGVMWCDHPVRDR